MSQPDDDVPAIEATQSDDDTGEESTVDEVATDEVAEPRNRRYTPQVRELMKKASAAVAAQLKADEDDEVPFDAEEVPAAEAAKPAGIAAKPAESPTAAAEAVAARQAAALEAREKALREDEAKFAEREKALVARESLKATYTKKPGVAIRDLVKEWSGAETDDELRDEISDLISDLSAEVLGIELGADHKTRLESKRGVRQVKAHLRSIESEKAALDAKRAEVEQAQRESSAVIELGRIFAQPEIAAKWEFLADEPDPAAIVFDVVKAHHKKHGEILEWEEAAAQADAYFKKQFEATTAKYAKRLKAPAPSANQGKAVQPPRTPALQTKTPAPSTKPPTPAPDVELTPEERRRRSIKTFLAQQQSAAQ